MKAHAWHAIMTGINLNMRDWRYRPTGACRGHIDFIACGVSPSKPAINACYDTDVTIVQSLDTSFVGGDLVLWFVSVSQ
jgi:hypothetical protein